MPEPLKTTQDIRDEIKGIQLQIAKLENQIKHSTNPGQRNQWIRAKNTLAQKYNALAKRYNETTGKVASRVFERWAHR